MRGTAFSFSSLRYTISRRGAKICADMKHVRSSTFQDYGILSRTFKTLPQPEVSEPVRCKLMVLKRKPSCWPEQSALIKDTSSHAKPSNREEE